MFHQDRECCNLFNLWKNFTVTFKTLTKELEIANAKRNLTLPENAPLT
jgi:hypothetical protein